MTGKDKQTSLSLDLKGTENVVLLSMTLPRQVPPTTPSLRDQPPTAQSTAHRRARCSRSAQSPRHCHAYLFILPTTP